MQHLYILSRTRYLLRSLWEASAGKVVTVMMTTAAVGCMQGIQATGHGLQLHSSTLLLLLTKTFSVLVTIHLNSAWPCFISANFVCCSASEYFIFTTQHRELVSKVSNSI